MNAEYLKLKQEHDEITVEIQKLNKKQNEIRKSMREVCTHENTIKVDNGLYYDELIGIEEETKFKCTDCYRYFTKKELDQLKGEDRIATDKSRVN